MITWWNGLQLMQQVFAIFAIPATLILVIQTVLLLMGIGSDHDAILHSGDMHDGEAAYHDTGLRLFTLQGLVAFFAIGGWVGIAMIDLGLHSALAGLLAVVAGTLSLLLVAWLLGLMLRLQSSGNLDIRNAIGLTGEVYLRIPGNLQGYGKITLILQERSIEIDAMTDQPDVIETGRQIKVIARRGDRLLVRPML